VCLFIRRIAFRDKSIVVKNGPFRKTFCGISLSLLPEISIFSGEWEKDNRPTSSLLILLSDKSITRSFVSPVNKLLEIVQMLFPERNNLVADVKPRSVSFDMVMLFPDRFTVNNVVLLANSPLESRRRRLCERSSDWSPMSGRRVPTGRSFSWLTDRSSVTKLSNPFSIASFKYDS